MMYNRKIPKHVMILSANTQTQAPIGFQANDFDLQDSTDLLQDSILQVVLDTSDAIITKAFDPFSERFITYKTFKIPNFGLIVLI